MPELIERILTPNGPRNDALVRQIDVLEREVGGIVRQIDRVNTVVRQLV